MCSATGEPQGANLSGVLRTEHTVGAAGTLMPTRREPTCKLAANDLGATGRGHPHIVGGLPPGVSSYQPQSPHREAIHDWRDRQQRRTFRNDGQDSEFGGSAMMPEAQVGDCDG